MRHEGQLGGLRENQDVVRVDDHRLHRVVHGRRGHGSLRHLCGVHVLDDHRGHGMMDVSHGRRVVRGHHGHGSLRRRCVLDDHRGHGMMDVNHDRQMMGVNRGRHVGHDHRGHGTTDVNHDRHRVGRGRHGHGVVRRHQTCCHHDVGRHCDRHRRRRAVGDALRGLAFRGVRVRLVRPQ